MPNSIEDLKAKFELVSKTPIHPTFDEAEIRAQATAAILEHWEENKRTTQGVKMGIAIRAMNDWTRLGICVTGGISFGVETLGKDGEATTPDTGYPIYDQNFTQPLPRIVEETGHGNWDKVKDIDVSRVPGWQEVANALNAPYLLTICSQYAYVAGMKNPLMIIYQGVVIPIK